MLKFWLSFRSGTRAVSVVLDTGKQCVWIAKLFHEKVPIDPPGDGQIALLTEFGVELVDHLVGVGLGDAQLLGHFLHAHKVLCLH